MLIRGDKDTANSTAVRALADLLERPFWWWKTAPPTATPEIQEGCRDLCFEKSQVNYHGLNAVACS
ncbi:MAG: hypothetical protein NTV25_09065 [Methanothrix sp.]|nr:hypothetical protein [Methanothrix sp.]